MKSGNLNSVSELGEGIEDIYMRNVGYGAERVRAFSEIYMSILVILGLIFLVIILLPFFFIGILFGEPKQKDEETDHYEVE